MLQIFERRVLTSHQRDYDIAVARSLRALDQRIIAIEDARLNHGIARDFKRIMFASAEQCQGYGERALPFHRLDRHTRCNAAMKRNFDDIVGRHRDCASRAARFGQRRGTAQLYRRCITALRNFQHLERARAVRQATDKPALFQGANEAMYARLALEIEGFLHFLKGG